MRKTNRVKWKNVIANAQKPFTRCLCVHLSAKMAGGGCPRHHTHKRRQYIIYIYIILSLFLSLSLSLFIYFSWVLHTHTHIHRSSSIYRLTMTMNDDDDDGRRENSLLSRRRRRLLLVGRRGVIIVFDGKLSGCVVCVCVMYIRAAACRAVGWKAAGENKIWWGEWGAV